LYEKYIQYLLNFVTGRYEDVNDKVRCPLEYELLIINMKMITQQTQAYGTVTTSIILFLIGFDSSTWNYSA